MPSPFHAGFGRGCRRDVEGGAPAGACERERIKRMEDASLSQELLRTKHEMLAAEIKHEDNLIGQRMTWLVISQSFLFGTFVTLLGQANLRSERLALTLVGLVGLGMPTLVLISVGTAISVIWRWRLQQERLYELPGAKELDWPRLKNWKRTMMLGHLVPILVPLGFLIVWTVILVRIGRL